jgi:hypothetical protein
MAGPLFGRFMWCNFFILTFSKKNFFINRPVGKFISYLDQGASLPDTLDALQGARISGTLLVHMDQARHGGLKGVIEAAALHGL